MLLDIGHEETEILIALLEERIKQEYSQASEEMKLKALEYFAAFRKKDKTWKTRLENKEITKAEYDAWRTGQLIVGKRWLQLRDELAAILVNAYDVALSLVSHDVPRVYALNHNYMTYLLETDSQIDTLYKIIDESKAEELFIDALNNKTAEETAAKAAKKAVEAINALTVDESFTIYDIPTVERLMRNNPKVLPPSGQKIAKEIAEGKAQLWDVQQLQSVATQAVIQGESVDQIAERLAEKVSDSDMKAAIRNARTMMTTAQNAGREASMLRAEKLGIHSSKVWRATLDGRTRHEHRLLDGQRRKADEAFEVNGQKIRYPGDLEAPPSLVWNCRCTLIEQIDGFEYDINGEEYLENGIVKYYEYYDVPTEGKDGVTRLYRKKELKEISYNEWKYDKPYKKKRGVSA